MTGRDFADLIEVDFDALNKSREEQRPINERAFLTLAKLIIEKYEEENEAIL